MRDILSFIDQTPNFSVNELEMQPDLFEKEMTLINSSRNYQYNLQQLEFTHDYMEKNSLCEKLDTLKEDYFAAREVLLQYDPEKVMQIEHEIIDQSPNFSDVNGIFH